MNGFCPNCEKVGPLRIVRKMEEFDVRGELISVEVENFQCQECGEEFENSKLSSDPYETAYRIYRERKGMLQSEEIREFRLKRGLTQKEFSELLRIGIATLNRYENGALQSEAHDRAIRLTMEPRNFSNLVSNSRNSLSQSKKQKIMTQLAEESEISWIESTMEAFGNYPADIYSGFRSFDLTKFFEAIKYFCFDTRTPKTKLLKLLFYSDFGHFKSYSVSITGARYARLPYGPVPDQFEKWLAALLMEDGVQVQEEWYQDHPCEVYTSSAPDLSIFTPSELRVLAAVKEKFEEFSARKISEVSHKENGYRETQPAHLISYEFASDLSFEF